MNKFLICLILLLFIHLQYSCTKESESKNTGNPFNLSVDIEVSESVYGLVHVTAFADNAVRYELYSGDFPVESNETGKFERQYTQIGSYTFEIRAYGSSGRYMKASRTFSIGERESVPLSRGYFSPVEYEGYHLTWSDEFNGNGLDLSAWTFEIGNGCPGLCGWGNNELQYYRMENLEMGDSTLTIVAKNENFQGFNYTSTRIKTQNKKTFKYGRVDIRALLPQGQGIWPALWMLGSNIESVGWPSCGELDIMELIGGGGRDNEIHGTLHWDNGGRVLSGKGYSLDSGIFADSYHVFSIIWDDISIKWLVDDYQFNEINITPAHMNEFHEEFFFIFNVAIGGNWPGNPDNTTIFDQRMKVDYIRVFQKQ